LLLTILFYLVILDSFKKVAHTMGLMTFSESEYVKIFDFTILVETFLNMLTYPLEKLNIAEVHQRIPI